MKFRNFRSIQMQILTNIGLMIIGLIIVLDSVFYYLSVQVITREAKASASQITAQIGRNIDYYVNYMQDISSIIRYSSAKEGDVLVKTIPQTRSDIVTIVLLNRNEILLADKDDYQIKGNTDVASLDWYRQAVEAGGEPVLSSSHVQNFIVDQYPWVVSLSSAIYDEQDQFVGVLLIDMNYKVFTDLCSNVEIGERGYLFLMDSRGEMVYHPSQQLIHSNVKKEDTARLLQTENGSFNDKQDGVSRIVTVQSLQSIDWKVVGVTYMDDILIQKEVLMKIMVLLTLVCLIVATVISIKVSSNLSGPLSQLEKMMKRVEKGDLDLDIRVSGRNEVAHLAHTFSIMVRRIKSLLLKIEEDQSELRKSELKTLYAQINPHFLYNSLDTIIWTAEQGEHQKVVRMTSALSKYFRLSLSRGHDIIPVYQEIEHIKYYLVIQKIRYESKLEYEIGIDQDLYSYKMLKTLLQPLVENALYHGIKNKPGGGKIWISGKRSGDRLTLQVRDDGVGMSKEKLARLLIFKEDEPLTSGGVAIINVHQRIQLSYGLSYGLQFESVPGEGTTVTVFLPIVE